ncbi:esterase/lipase family protein [Corynebacterium comes]|uniref:Lipase EstA n=1 Tax=Corynebacterium comes TaxID=2675218 RepID=A0A6B8W309_9CORY|nr:alpha/beta fold hydrolase [Corynebacterium comes]QGU05835.1 Lipase EstA precursor [Corynebacterium comes]
MKSFRRTIGVLASVAAATIACSAIAAAAPALPDQSSLPPQPGIDPVFNDPGCVPSPAHPNPVVYFHGTGTQSNEFADSARFLRDQGFCLWTRHYGTDSDTIRNNVPGHNGLGPVDDAADELAAFVDEVLATTGAGQVDLVGYSLGGTLTKVYIQGRDGAGKVGRSISFGATYRGTDLVGVTHVAGSALNANRGSAEYLIGASTFDQFEGSEFIARVNDLPDTTPGIIYTAFYTPSETVATPYTTSMLQPVDGTSVANVDMEAACGRTFTHRDLPRSPETPHLVYWGLTRAAENTAATRQDCGS